MGSLAWLQAKCSSVSDIKTPKLMAVKQIYLISKKVNSYDYKVVLF